MKKKTLIQRFMWQFECISLEGMVIFSNSLLLSGIIGAHLTAISQTLHPSILSQTFPILFSQSLSVIFTPQVSCSLWNKYYLSIDTVQNSTIGFMDYLGKVKDDHRNPFLTWYVSNIVNSCILLVQCTILTSYLFDFLWNTD